MGNYKPFHFPLNAEHGSFRPNDIIDWIVVAKNMLIPKADWIMLTPLLAYTLYIAIRLLKTPPDPVAKMKKKQ